MGRSLESAPVGQAAGRSHEAAPARQTPTARSLEPAPPRQAPTAAISDASSGGAPSDQRGLRNLGAVIERDLIDATADAKRQGEDFKALQDRLRRAWGSVFGGGAEK
jgi:hypothetical protein